MQDANLAFLVQKTVGQGNKIMIPEEVRELLFQDPTCTDNTYVWNYDAEDDYIIVSNHSLRENQSSIQNISEVEDDNPRRTRVPKKIMNKFDLNVRDDLYFVTPEGIESGTPAAFVWTFNQIEEIILGGADRSESGFPRHPHF